MSMKPSALGGSQASPRVRDRGPAQARHPVVPGREGNHGLGQVLLLQSHPAVEPEHSLRSSHHPG